jgi:hypothetical protein
MRISNNRDDKESPDLGVIGIKALFLLLSESDRGTIALRQSARGFLDASPSGGGGSARSERKLTR